jgi:hypothetical protein
VFFFTRRLFKEKEYHHCEAGRRPPFDAVSSSLIADFTASKRSGMEMLGSRHQEYWEHCFDSSIDLSKTSVNPPVNAVMTSTDWWAVAPS